MTRLCLKMHHWICILAYICFKKFPVECPPTPLAGSSWPSATQDFSPKREILDRTPTWWALIECTCKATSLTLWKHRKFSECLFYKGKRKHSFLVSINGCNSLLQRLAWQIRRGTETLICGTTHTHFIVSLG